MISTKYNLLGVDLSDCYAIESDIIVYYSYILEILFTVLSILVIVFGYKHNITRRKEIIIFLVGIALFLLAFSFGNIVGSFTEDWVTAQYGLFGMPIFMGFLSYLIVKFHTFNVKLIAAQALVWGMVLLIGSQFFFIRNPINRVLNGVTFISVIIFGYFLVKSVKIEIEQKEQLAKLNIDLQNVIKQRESLVHLITHKVKGSFTRTKFIFAGLLDGTFGEVSPEVKKIATQGLEFDNGGIQTVDLVLNVANLQNGLIKYDMKNIDFKDVVLKTVEDKKVGAEAKGLKIETDIKDGSYQVNGDSFWLKEVVNNLIENSIKYTKEGVIKVGLGVKGKNALLSIVDTGLGITEEDKKNLFTEGGRGKDSVKVNVDSTGYGLFTVKMVVQEHKGRVWAESEGAGKGSQLYVELPVI
ncbi:MAG: HAMP domain-containing sensor histidine kinase [Candidatus Paceibacterota bacterium]